mmetsp:Transcript_23301/g.59845  ORF Transcript_23301/g.59845 Transcript_23301/m.59845 type:complete len:270 (+) Transcript_23301:238-1047(+)
MQLARHAQLQPIQRVLLPVQRRVVRQRPFHHLQSHLKMPLVNRRLAQGLSGPENREVRRVKNRSRGIYRLHLFLQLLLCLAGAASRTLDTRRHGPRWCGLLAAHQTHSLLSSTERWRSCRTVLVTRARRAPRRRHLRILVTPQRQRRPRQDVCRQRRSRSHTPSTITFKEVLLFQVLPPAPRHLRDVHVRDQHLPPRPQPVQAPQRQLRPLEGGHRAGGAGVVRRGGGQVQAGTYRAQLRVGDGEGIDGEAAECFDDVLDRRFVNGIQR